MTPYSFHATRRSPRRMTDLLAPFLVGACLASLLPTPAHAQQIQNNIPDFYQHQYWDELPAAQSRANWESDGGYCYFVSIEDALYYWEAKPQYTALFDDDIRTTAKWDPAFAVATENIVDQADNGFNPFGIINGYLDRQGVGPLAAVLGKPSLLSMWYEVDDTSGNVSVHLANNRVEVVTKNGQTVKAFDFYAAQLGAARTTVLTLHTTLLGQNGLWWWDSFHNIAGAGIDAANRTIYAADPDSNKGNTANRAGWFNLQANGTRDTSAAGVAAAVARVQNNRYTAADDGADVPLPGNLNGAGNAYTNADLYARLKIAGDGFTVAASDDLIGGNSVVAATGRYKGTRLSDIETVSPTLAAIKGAIQIGVNRIRSAFSLFGDPDLGMVDQMMLFPSASLTDTTSFTFDDPSWILSAVSTDPFGYSRTEGGILFTGSTFSPGAIGNGTVDTMTGFDFFDVFYHDATTDTWFVQSYGAPGNPNRFQSAATAAPEPGTVALLGTGLLLTLVARLRRTRRTG